MAKVVQTEDRAKKKLEFFQICSVEVQTAANIIAGRCKQVIIFPIYGCPVYNANA